MKVYDFGKIDENDVGRLTIEFMRVWQKPQSDSIPAANYLRPSTVYNSGQRIMQTEPITPVWGIRAQSSTIIEDEQEGQESVIGEEDDESAIIQGDKNRSGSVPNKPLTEAQSQQQKRQPSKPEQSYPSASEPLAFLDSGYASGGHVMGRIKSTLTESGRTKGQGDYIEPPAAGNSSIYSKSIASWKTKQMYISEFAHDLSIHLRSGPECIDHKALATFYSNLPQLLQSFARKIGYSGNSAESRDVMVFVSKYRRYVFSSSFSL